jgi:vancomycin resistance protein YoaR
MITTKPSSPLIIRLLKSLGLAAALFLVFLLAANLLFSAFYSNRILPGVMMNGLPLEGLTVDEATGVIGKAITFPDTGVILLMTSGKSWSVTPVQLGIYLDPRSSAQAAYDIGRKGNLLEILVKRISSFTSTSQVFPTFIYDQKASVAILQQIASQINQPIREASLSLNGTDVVVTQGQPGVQLDFASSLIGINNQVQTMQNGTVQLAVLQTVPGVLDASTQGELARSILSQPFTLTVPATFGEVEPVQIQPDVLAQLLAFTTSTGTTGSELSVSINPVLMKAYLSSISGNLNASPENARFVFNDDTRQLDLLPDGHATIGRTLNADGSVAAIDSAIREGAHNAELVFDVTNPPVMDDAKGSDLGITELVYAYTSYFRSSTADRVQNIKTASSRFHGLLIAPGDTLSMSDVLGDITLDNGYAEAMIILGDQTIKGVGGGVCQVSTTLFRTVFYSGLEILERHSHAYRVGYYEQTSSGHNQDLAGLDATVFVPIVDFKFRNDTPYWLLMETYVSSSNYSLTWKFYSTKDGRTVDYSSTGLTDVVKSPDPVYRENPDLPQGSKKQVDWAVDGATVTIIRTVTKDGQVIHNDRFYTKYQAWGDVYEYGPGTEGIPTPTPQP